MKRGSQEGLKKVIRRYQDGPKRLQGGKDPKKVSKRTPKNLKDKNLGHTVFLEREISEIVAVAIKLMITNRESKPITRTFEQT